MITVDTASAYAKMGVKPPPEEKLQELGKPSAGMPQGKPIPEGVVVRQVVGRGQPSMAVVPPKQEGGPPAPQIGVVPPSGASRTSLGTFVDDIAVARTVSNPLTSAPTPSPSGTIEPPVEATVEEAKAPPKRPQLDLAKEILNHIMELGGPHDQRAQEYYERGAEALKRWLNQPAAITLGAIEKLLKRNPGVKEALTEQLEPHFAANGQDGWTQSLPARGKMDCMVLSPILERPTLPYHWTTLYLAKKYELGFDIQADTAIWRSRNMLAHRFVASGARWSLWIDGDIAGPIANADWYRWITGSEVIPEEACRYDVLQRLLSHGKAIIGGVYASRRYHGQLVIQPDVHPRNHEDKLLSNEIRRGTARGLAAVDWIGFGCALVHREVFLEIQRRFPSLAPQAEFAPWRYFQPLGDEGEDEAFCQRVKACSIPIWLDTQLVCGHIGSMAFLPEHTAPVRAM